MPDDPRLRRVAHWQDTVAMPAYATREAWLERAAEIKEQVLFAAGLLPLPERTPLLPIVTGRQQRDGYAVDNVAFESFPGFYCTGNVYRPLGGGPFPVVLTPHGHWQEGRFAQRENGSVPARCINFARQGYLAFSPDMVGYVDSRQLEHRTLDTPAGHLWGIGALGLQLWNNIRALDYLLSLPGADPTRVACTGESGGATQTYLLAAVDERVRVVAPVNMLSAHYAGGCVCENAPGLRLGLTNMEIVAAAAPRPMLIVAATGDWTVNTPRVEFPAVRGVYELLGAADQLECVQLDAPHNYNLDSRQAVYGFLARHLGGSGAPVPLSQKQVFRVGTTASLAETPGSRIEAVESLRVFTDATRPAGWEPLDTAALKVARWRSALADYPFDQEGLERFRARLRAPFLRAVGAAAPTAADVVLPALPAPPQEAGTTQLCLLQLGTRNHGERFSAVLIRSAATDEGAVPVLFLHPGGREAALHEPALPTQRGGPITLRAGDEAWHSPLLGELVSSGRNVLVPDVFLTGDYLSPVGRAGRPTNETHFTTYNRTDVMWRVQDTLTAAVALCTLAGTSEVDAVGLSEAGAWALLARAVAPALFRRLIADACDEDWSAEALYLDRLYVPHLSRLGGLYTASALAAPAPLYLFNAGRSEHEPVKRLYTGLRYSGALEVAAGPLPGT
jgi:dienelactone hydrolase